MGFSSIWMSKSYLKCRYFDNNVISIVLAGFSKNGLNAFWKSAPQVLHLQKKNRLLYNNA